MVWLLRVLAVLSVTMHIDMCVYVNGCVGICQQEARKSSS